MLKRTHFLFVILLFCSSLYADAQTYVNIPDANFRAALQQIIPTCFNASGQLDISCSNISTVGYLPVGNKNIQDLTGVEYLTSLHQLDCPNNQLTALPALPNSLTYLRCDNNQITALGTLPNSVNYLSCTNNLISSVSSFPTSLNYVYISDNNLNALPALPTGLSYMDCSRNNLNALPAILPNNLQQLNCSDNNLTNLPTITANVYLLNCDSNNISILPSLPNTLSYLYCSHNPVSSFTNLPTTLYQLKMAYTAFSALPTLPTSLQILDVSGNPNMAVTTVPANIHTLICRNNNWSILPTLSTSLQTLDCAYNNFSTLSLTSFNQMYYLDISGNPFTTIPNIPSSTNYLIISYLNLTSLPTLPTYLNLLDCSHNNLSTLPISQTYMGKLDCSYNQLSTLPPINCDDLNCSHNNLVMLPGMSCYSLNCSYNQLTYLPYLTASSLNVSNNPLGCLPTLIDTLVSLDISNTFVSCLPNIPAAMPNLSAQTGLPLCSGTSGVCQGATIKGKAYFDTNNNGVQDAGEAPMGYRNIKATNPQMGTFNTLTDANGDYTLTVNPSNLDYQVNSVYTYYTMYSIINPVAGYSVSLPTISSTSINNDFYVNSSPFNDLAAYLYADWARIGFDRNFYLHGVNYGTTTQNATITFTFDPHYTFVSSSVLPTSQVGNTLTFSLPNLQPYYMNYPSPPYPNIHVVLNLDISTPVGITVANTVSIDPVTNDILPANNTYTLYQTTTNAIDPNVKNVDYKVITPQQVSAAQSLGYRIDFQNTGTDTAYTVVVTDTLSDKVQLESLEMLSASHPFTLSIKDNNILVWTFLNIMLTDSNTNEATSHGFINYRIRPKTTLQLGEEIHNSANIYFDYNDAVITNTAITKVGAIGQNITLAKDLNLSVFPNPVKEKLQIKVEGKSRKYLDMKIFDAQGKVVFAENIKDFSGEMQKSVEVKNWAKGIYLLQMTTDNGVLVEKISVE